MEISIYFYLTMVLNIVIEFKFANAWNEVLSEILRQIPLFGVAV